MSRSFLIEFQILCLLKILHSQPWPVWLSWLEHCAVNRKVVGSTSSQGTYLGLVFGPWLGYVGKATVDGCCSLTSIFLSLSLPSPLLKSMSMSSGGDKIYIYCNLLWYYLSLERICFSLWWVDKSGGHYFNSIRDCVKLHIQKLVVHLIKLSLPLFYPWPSSLTVNWQPVYSMRPFILKQFELLISAHKTDEKQCSAFQRLST